MRTDKTAFLAAERLEPFTPAEQAAAAGRAGEYARDVPRTCICLWRFSRRDRRYTFVSWVTGCPWHAEETR